MTSFEFLTLGARPRLVRKDTLAEAADMLARSAKTPSRAVPLVIASSAGESSKAHALRWQKIAHWMLEPKSTPPAEVIVVHTKMRDFESRIAQLESKFRTRAEPVTVFLCADSIGDAVGSDRSTLEAWSRKLFERVKRAEAAETALWSTVVFPMQESTAREGTDAAAFQNAVQRRDGLIASETWLSSEEISQAARGGVLDSNANQYAYQLRQAGRIFGVRHQRKRVHPACQFFEDEGSLQPLPVMKKLIELWPKDDSGWTQAFWLFQPTGRLDKARPADVLATQPDDVLLAAKKDFHGDDGI